MKIKQNIVIIGLVMLALGLIAGYFVGVNRGTPVADSTTSGVHGAISGMMSGLEGKTGDALDEAFLAGMIVHHQGAILMSEVLLKGTQRPELIKLGNDIITAQTGEIEMMKKWLKDWFNK